jgi:hypothetical protein
LNGKVYKWGCPCHPFAILIVLLNLEAINDMMTGLSGEKCREKGKTVVSFIILLFKDVPVFGPRVSDMTPIEYVTIIASQTESNRFDVS